MQHQVCTLGVVIYAHVFKYDTLLPVELELSLVNMFRYFHPCTLLLL